MQPDTETNAQWAIRHLVEIRKALVTAQCEARADPAQTETADHIAYQIQALNYAIDSVGMLWDLRHPEDKRHGY